MKNRAWIPFLSLLFLLLSLDSSFGHLPRTSSLSEIVSKMDKEKEAKSQIAFSDMNQVAKDYGYQPHLCREIWGYTHTKDCADNFAGVRMVASDPIQVSAKVSDEASNEDIKDEEEEDIFEDPFADEEEVKETIADPFEPINRFFFHFNDKLYSWVLRPVAKGYSAVVPKPARICVRNFFHNIADNVAKSFCF